MAIYMALAKSEDFNGSVSQTQSKSAYIILFVVSLVLIALLAIVPKLQYYQLGKNQLF